MEQDVGQEKFGATQCRVCGMVYTPVDAADEAAHAKFHQSTVAALKFPVSRLAWSTFFSKNV